MIELKKDYETLLNTLKKRYENKHVSKLERYKNIKYQSSRYISANETWSYYKIDNYTIVATLQYNRIESITYCY